MGSGVLRLRRREVAAIVAIAIACAPSPAQAAEPGDYQALAQAIAAPWPGRQHSDGHFQEYVPGHDPRNKDDYGEAMLGYGLLQAGVRAGDQAMIIAGLNGVTHDAELPDSDAHIRMFRDMAIAGAYNLARDRLAGDEYFQRLRPAWERRLREVTVDRLRPGKKVTNKTLVEAVMVLELERSGLSAGAPGTVLADLPGSVALVRRLVDRTLPRVRVGNRTLLGDAPDFPPAYHALSTAFLARAIELLGPRAPARSKQLLHEALAASSALAGPDGDLTYWGRSQEQIWALTLTAYAAEFGRGALPASDVAPLGALADRALTRVSREHRGGPGVFAITPALAQSIRGGTRGVDSYASSVQYSGLNLVATNWAADAAHPGLPVGELPADREGPSMLGRGTSRFATVRAGDIWFAVRQSPSTSGDLRYDFGLVALKQRDPDGTWHDELPLRPHPLRVPDSAGPLLNGARPVGRSLSVARFGRVTIKGDYPNRRGVQFVFQPNGCRGLQMTVSPTRPTDRYEYSWFVRPGDVGLHGRRERGYASGMDPTLTRIRKTQHGHFEVTTCR
jgi:hypothetical protein